MGLDPRSSRLVDDLRAWIEAAVQDRMPFEPPERLDREDARTLATRWRAGPHVWYEVAIRPFLPQLRVSMLTDDPDRSRDLERLVEEEDYTLQEFVARGLQSAGLAWPQPPVEHYCERGTAYYFATPLDLESIDILADPQFRERVLKVLMGYHRAFSGEPAGPGAAATG